VACRTSRQSSLMFAWSATTNCHRSIASLLWIDAGE
jgi:hypothetical protein